MGKPDIIMVVIGADPIAPGMLAQITADLPDKVIVVDGKTTLEEIRKGAESIPYRSRDVELEPAAIQQPIFCDERKTGKQRANEARDRRNRSRMHYRK